MTLFLDENESGSIEYIREKFNPEQYRLIKSHITLCREDEIGDLKTIQKNLTKLKVEIFELETGRVIRFSEGKGVLVKVKDNNQFFQKLRELVLQDVISKPRQHNAHITLMHPRNSTCNDSVFEEIRAVQIAQGVRVSKISLVEQEVGKEWKTIKEYQLKNKS